MRILLRILIILFINVISYSQEGQWVESEGRFPGVNVTPEEGQRKALELAQSEAIKKVVGLRVNEETFRHLTEIQASNQQDEYFDIFSRLGRSTTSGKILQEESQFYTLIENNYPVYYVKLKAFVVEEKGDTDPGFSVKINMPRDVFYDRGIYSKNDKLEFNIEATKDCYIYLFNIMANDSVQLLIPNQYLKDNSYNVNKYEQEYEKKINSLGINFTVGLSPNRVSQKEALLVIALKDKIDFMSGNFSKEDQSIIPTYRAAMTDIMNWLIQIPVDRRTEAFRSFEIRKN